MIDFDGLLTDDEKNAIAVLEAGGFLSLADVKINECRDLNTGGRLRSFRHRGRYDLVIAMRKMPKRKIGTGHIAPELKPVDEMKRSELLDEAKSIDSLSGEYKLSKAELAEIVKSNRMSNNVV